MIILVPAHTILPVDRLCHKQKHVSSLVADYNTKLPVGYRDVTSDITRRPVLTNIENVQLLQLYYLIVFFLLVETRSGL